MLVIPGPMAGYHSTGDRHRGVYGGDRLQDHRPWMSGRPSDRQSSQRDPFGLELNHDSVRRHDPQPQRRELLQKVSFLRKCVLLPEMTESRRSMVPRSVLVSVSIGIEILLPVGSPILGRRTRPEVNSIMRLSPLRVYRGRPAASPMPCPIHSTGGSPRVPSRSCGRSRSRHRGPSDVTSVYLRGGNHRGRARTLGRLTGHVENPKRRLDPVRDDSLRRAGAVLAPPLSPSLVRRSHELIT